LIPASISCFQFGTIRPLTLLYFFGSAS
jgi:hypothetical protein